MDSLKNSAKDDTKEEMIINDDNKLENSKEEKKN